MKERVNPCDDSSPALVSGPELRRRLGFRSGEAFRNAVRQGRVPVPVLKLPGRRGWFARTADLERWRARLEGQERDGPQE